MSVDFLCFLLDFEFRKIFRKIGLSVVAAGALSFNLAGFAQVVSDDLKPVDPVLSLVSGYYGRELVVDADGAATLKDVASGFRAKPLADIYEKLKNYCTSSSKTALVVPVDTLWDSYSDRGADRPASAAHMLDNKISMQRLMRAQKVAWRNGPRSELKSKIVTQQFASRLGINPREFNWAARGIPFACVDYAMYGFREIKFYAGFAGRLDGKSQSLETVNFIYMSYLGLNHVNDEILAPFFSDVTLGTTEAALQAEYAESLKSNGHWVHEYRAENVSEVVKSVGIGVYLEYIRLTLKNSTNNPVTVFPAFVDNVSVDGKTYAMVYKLDNDRVKLSFDKNMGCVELTAGRQQVLLNPGASCEVKISDAVAFGLKSAKPNVAATAKTLLGSLRMVPISGKGDVEIPLEK